MDKTEHKTVIIVSEEIQFPILYGKTCRQLGQISKEFPKVQLNTLEGGRTQVTKDILIKDFEEVFDGQVRTMPREKFKITLKEGIIPYAESTPRKIALI